MALLSTLFVAHAASSHEIEPSVVEVMVQDSTLVLTIDLSAESVLAGVDLSASTNTSSSDNEAEYDRLRALSPEALGAAFRDKWGNIKSNYYLNINNLKYDLNLLNLTIPEQNNPEIARTSTLTISADLPQGAEQFQFGWDPSYGLMVLRHSVENGGFAAYVEPGDLSPEIRLEITEPESNFTIFAKFIPVGFDHILPKGLDHILFVVGLFLFSTKWKPLLWQVSAFTVAHTITLALASLGVVTVSASIVEPLIALSIAYVAIENIFSTRLALWRPALIFAFGLLHGLGFASVLDEFGLPGAGLVAALVGFNVGVEVGQLVVIAICFGLVGIWFGNASWYRQRITIPASAVIALIGLWWTIERTFL